MTTTVVVDRTRVRSPIPPGHSRTAPRPRQAPNRQSHRLLNKVFATIRGATLDNSLALCNDTRAGVGYSPTKPRASGRDYS